MHQESSANAAFVDACNAVKSSYHEADFNPRAFYKDVKSLKKLRKERIFNESEFEAKLQQLKNENEVSSGNKVEQQATKRETRRGGVGQAQAQNRRGQ
jgi:hypothetical protein